MGVPSAASYQRKIKVKSIPVSGTKIRDGIEPAKPVKRHLSETQVPLFIVITQYSE